MKPVTGSIMSRNRDEVVPQAGNPCFAVDSGDGDFDECCVHACLFP
jgi:hypothetical protein